MGNKSAIRCFEGGCTVNVGEKPPAKNSQEFQTYHNLGQHSAEESHPRSALL